MRQGRVFLIVSNIHTHTHTHTQWDAQFSSVQLLSCIWLFETPWTAAHQASLSITTSRSRPKPMSIVSVMPSNHLILGHPLLLPSMGWSVQFSSVAQSCMTLCDPMNHSTPGLPVYHHLPEFTQTHVHWVGDAIQPSHPLSSPSPPAPNPSQHQSLFQWVNSSLSHKKEWNPAICNSMDGPWRYYTKWNKSDKDKYPMFSLRCGI